MIRRDWLDILSIKKGGISRDIHQRSAHQKRRNRGIRKILNNVVVIAMCTSYVLLRKLKIYTYCFKLQIHMRDSIRLDLFCGGISVSSGRFAGGVNFVVFFSGTIDHSRWSWKGFYSKWDVLTNDFTRFIHEWTVGITSVLRHLIRNEILYFTWRIWQPVAKRTSFKFWNCHGISLLWRNPGFDNQYTSWLSIY